MPKITLRRFAREIAMSILFEFTFEAYSLNELFELRLTESYFSSVAEENKIYARFLPNKEIEYVKKIADGVLAHKFELDTAISKNLSGWSITRLSRVSVQILRIAIFEMLFCEDIPISVSMNEAVELAKKYDVEEAGNYINGILSSVKKELE